MVMQKQPFHKLLNDIATVLLTTTTTAVGRKKWRCAYLVHLWPPEGGGNPGLEKFRIEMADGVLIVGVRWPDDLTYLVDDLWGLQHGLFERTWYGIKVNVFPDGTCNPEYDYDKECMSRGGERFLDSMTGRKTRPKP
jgi:hypothetical protein